jgi:hypothetical protein
MNEYEISMLEQTRRSLAMLQTNCLALHRDDAIRLIEQLQAAVATIKDLRRALEAVMGRP